MPDLKLSTAQVSAELGRLSRQIEAQAVVHHLAAVAASADLPRLGRWLRTEAPEMLALLGARGPISLKRIPCRPRGQGRCGVVRAAPADGRTGGADDPR